MKGEKRFVNLNAIALERVMIGDAGRAQIGGINTAIGVEGFGITQS